MDSRITGSMITRIIQSLYYAPAGRDSADKGRSIIRVRSMNDRS